MKCETLHLCHIDPQINLDNYIGLVSKNDAVVFYSEELKKTLQTKLKAMLKNQKIYFIVTNNSNNLETICYDEWVNLVNSYNRTFSWK